jgi:LAS superfamily LD-carboxypeptidase LdcB
VKVVALACAVVLGAVASGCVRATAVAPVAVSNGQIPPEMLTTITPQCDVRSDLADQLNALLIAAAADGVGLVPETSSFLPPGTPGPPKIESCYRSFAGQQWWKNYYCSVGKCNLAAVPGRSKHGWGRAVDFQDQLGELTFTSPGYAWLQAHASLFGFMQPPSVQQGGANAEAWHWEVPE